MSTVGSWLSTRPWVWSLFGSMVMWVMVFLLSSHGLMGSLLINAGTAAFLAIVGLGQMLTITSGQGGIDLSIPYVMTLAAYVSITIMNGSNAHLWVAVAVSILLGIGVGLINSFSILVLRIPPIIATLAIGFVLESIIIVFAGQQTSFLPSPLLEGLAQNSVLGIPLILVPACGFAVVVAFMLFRTSFGLSLRAAGQNRRASFLAGVRVDGTIVGAYVLCGTLAAIGGLLLAGSDGGAFIAMGNAYLLESVGAVVIGGTLIIGGKPTVLGTLFGALFLTMLVTLAEITKLPIGIQDVIEGAAIIVVLVLANRPGTRRRMPVKKQR